MQIGEQRMEMIVDKSKPEQPRQYIKAEFLGKGGFAECYKVIEVSKEKREYACKIISKKDYFDERKKELA